MDDQLAAARAAAVRMAASAVFAGRSAAAVVRRQAAPHASQVPAAERAEQATAATARSNEAIAAHHSTSALESNQSEVCEWNVTIQKTFITVVPVCKRQSGMSTATRHTSTKPVRRSNQSTY